MAVSAGLYGSENWVLTEKNKNRIQAAEMRFLTATLGVTSQDRLTDVEIAGSNPSRGMDVCLRFSVLCCPV
jgi:hypothetical protein